MYKSKSKVIAFALWLFLGLFGGHRFYLKNYIMGICQFLTFGGFGVWWVIDVFLIWSRVDLLNATSRFMGMNNANLNANTNTQVINVNIPAQEEKRVPNKEEI